MIFIYTDNVYLKLTMLVNKRTTKLPIFYLESKFNTMEIYNSVM